MGKQITIEISRILALFSQLFLSGVEGPSQEVGLGKSEEVSQAKGAYPAGHVDEVAAAAGILLQTFNEQETTGELIHCITEMISI